MNYINTIKMLISPIIKDISDVQIRLLNENSEDLEILIMTNNDNLAKLIGKKGVVIDAIRRLINVKASREKKRIKISLESFSSK